MSLRYSADFRRSRLVKSSHRRFFSKCSILIALSDKTYNISDITHEIRIWRIRFNQHYAIVLNNSRIGKTLLFLSIEQTRRHGPFRTCHADNRHLWLFQTCNQLTISNLSVSVFTSSIFSRRFFLLRKNARLLQWPFLVGAFSFKEKSPTITVASFFFFFFSSDHRAHRVCTTFYRNW